MEKFSFKDVLILFAGTIITIGIAWVLLTVTGFVPREIGKLFFEGAVVGQRNILNTLNIATPYILTSIATVVSFRVGMFNIGIKKFLIQITAFTFSISGNPKGLSMFFS